MKSESYLHTLNEEECFQIEKMDDDMDANMEHVREGRKYREDIRERVCPVIITRPAGNSISSESIRT